MAGGAGVFVPLATPFNFEGELYRAKVAHNVGKLETASVAGYVIGSSTGEGPLLSAAELLTLFDLVVTERPRYAVISHPSVRVAGELSLEFMQRGARGIIIESPWTGAEDTLYSGALSDRVPIVEIDAPPLANALPYAYITIYEADRSREFEAAEDWRNRLAPIEAVVAKHGVGGLKYAMELTGYHGGPPRLPRMPLSRAAQLEIEDALAELRS